MGVVGEQVRESTRAFTDVFRNRGLRRVNLALAGSVIGDWAYGIAVSIWAYQQGGATALGVFGVIRFVALALLAPVTSTFADRFPRVAVMILADLTRMVLVVIAAGVIALDGPALAVYGLALVTSAIGTAFRPAQAALLPTLANDPKELTGANVVASTIESVGFFVGPAIGGLLLAVADIEIVYLFNAATFLWSSLMLVGVGAAVQEATAPATASDTVNPDEVDQALHAAADVASSAEEPGSTERDGFLREVTAGFRAIGSHRDLRLIAALYACQTVVAGASLVYELAIVAELLELDESRLGILDSVLGVGGIIGGVVALALARRERIATDFGIGVFLWAAPLLLIVVWPSLWSTLIAMFLIGLANSLVDINAYTIIQRVAPAEVMARVFGALESIVITGMAVGALAMPIMIATIGLRAGLAVFGVGIAVLVLVVTPGLVRMDRQVLAPAGLSTLRRVPMLAPLPAPILERLARGSATMAVPAGSYVFREGDRGDRFWVIERGTVSVWIEGAEIRRLGEGDSFGEIALLRDVPRTASVRAEDDLVIRGIERDDFLAAVSAHGEAYEMADAVVNRYLTLA
jgi:MFS family permease